MNRLITAPGRLGSIPLMVLDRWFPASRAQRNAEVAMDRLEARRQERLDVAAYIADWLAHRHVSA